MSWQVVTIAQALSLRQRDLHALGMLLFLQQPQSPTKIRYPLPVKLPNKQASTSVLLVGSFVLPSCLVWIVIAFTHLSYTCCSCVTTSIKDSSDIEKASTKPLAGRQDISIKGQT
jgi:hypothetical protein